MKKIVSLILVFAMSAGLCACGGEEKSAFNTSKAAYDKVSAAYQITAEFGSDIYEAWRLGIYEDDEVLSSGAKYLATELSLSETEIKEGIAYVLAVEVYGKEWDSLSDSEKKEYMNMAAKSSVFRAFEDNLFSFCVMIVSGAYVVNGKAAEVQTSLDDAKSLMKDLSEKYSDYEHYPNLKGYYTTTKSFFEFCQNPTGSFEQVKTTINDYKNEARDYISDLDYIFEE